MNVIAVLLIASLTSFSNVNAIDLSKLGLGDNFGQDASCVVVVVGCEGTGSVDSTGDTIIGSNNGNGNNKNDYLNRDGIGTRDGTLFVSKEIVCRSTNGTPSDDAVCNFAESSPNYPQIQNFSFTVSGNNPKPSSFIASPSGTSVNLEPGNYTVVEGLSNGFDIDHIRFELNALSATLDGTGVKGDCDFIDHVTATGLMTSNGSKECTFINTITFNFGTVPAQ